VDGYRLVAGNVEGQRIGSVTVEALEERPPLQDQSVPTAGDASGGERASTSESR
jgi:hypothetical protein